MFDSVAHLVAQVTTMPVGSPIERLLRDLGINDPLAIKIVYAAAAFIVLVIVLSVVSRRRTARRATGEQAALRRGYDEFQWRQKEINRLALRIEATSSTGRIAGFAIVRQVEAVFTEGRASSAAALELCKAMAAQKGANAIINLQTRQTPTGKWTANGDAVLVKSFSRLDSKPPIDEPPKGEASDDETDAVSP